MKHVSSRHTPKRWGVKKAHVKGKSLYNKWMHIYAQTSTRIYIQTYIYTPTYRTSVYMHTCIYTHILQGRYQGRGWVFLIYELYNCSHWNRNCYDKRKIRRTKLQNQYRKFRSKRDLSKCPKYVYLQSTQFATCSPADKQEDQVWGAKWQQQRLSEIVIIYQMTICKIINNTCHKITCDLLFKRMTMKHVSSRHTPKRWGVKKATSKKAAKLELYKIFAAPPKDLLDYLLVYCNKRIRSNLHVR